MLTINSFTKPKAFLDFNSSSVKSRKSEPPASYPLLHRLEKDTISFSGQLKTISGGENNYLAQKIAAKLQTGLTDTIVRPFHLGEDSETYVKIDGKIAGSDLVIVESTGGRPNDNIMQLLFATSAAKRNRANKITVVAPFYYYARQDRQTKEGEDVSAKTVANLLTATGADEIVVVDPHFEQFDAMFNIPVVKVSAMNLLAAKIKDELGSDIDNAVIVSPDQSGIKRVERFAEQIKDNCPTACVFKERTNINGDSTVVSTKTFGDVEGKTAVIVDDIIDSGDSIINAADLLVKNGANKVLICATHGLFSKNAYKKFNEANYIEKVIVTNTLPLKSGAPKKIEQIDISGLIADKIKKVHSES